MKTECKQCHRLLVRIRAEAHKIRGLTAYRYRDDRGKRWNGLRCPDCALANQTAKRHRAAGGGRLGRVQKYKPAQKGIESELVVKRFLEARGFSVAQADGEGPDLVLALGDLRQTCEVKTVIKSPRSKYYYTNPVSSGRRRDDYFAAVFDNQIVIFEPMDAHLKKCRPSGARRVTDEVLAALGSA